jgi:hypothetical protein
MPSQSSELTEFFSLVTAAEKLTRTRVEWNNIGPLMALNGPYSPVSASDANRMNDS